jgi:ferritin-like metal-binding protein YciE
MSTHQTQSEMPEAVSTTGLSEKHMKTMVDYLGDLVSIESHIEEALDRQLGLVKENTEASAAVHRFHDMVKANRDELQQHLDQMTGQKGNPVKEVGATLLGKAAGMIDKIRTEGVSKALRDDYVAFNLAAISYSMLDTTARALGDKKTAKLAEQGLRDYAGAVQEINQIISNIVVWELEKDGHQIESGAAEKARRQIQKTWKETAPQAGMVH